MNNKRINEIFSYINERNKETDHKLVVGRIESSLENGNWGHSIISTVFVPRFYSEKLLSSEERTDCFTRYYGISEINRPEDLFEDKLHYSGIGSDKLEPLSISWNQHNKHVYYCDIKFLMYYNLISRNSNEITYWDNPSMPKFGVVEIMSTSDYSVEKGYTPAYILMDRDYVEDFSYLKNSLVFEFYFEERNIKNIDEELERLLGVTSNVTYLEDGNYIKIMRSHGSRGKYNIQMWGKRCILDPKKSPISNPGELSLKWPGIEDTYTEREIKGLLDCSIFLKDEYLKSFENNDEYRLDPESGSVDYQGWWGIGSIGRVGRDYVELDLRKMYEGLPEALLIQLHPYAVEEEIVKTSITNLGERNIGLRAKEVITEYIHMFDCIHGIFSSKNLNYTIKDLCSYNPKDIKYYCWYHFPELREIGNTISLEASESYFCSRCSKLLTFFESIKEKPIRRLLVKLGVSAESINDKRAFKLLESLFIIINFISETGITIDTLNSDSIDTLDFNVQLESISFLFHLNDIRIYDSHRKDGRTYEAYIKALKYFDIDSNYMKSNGWGLALDKVYDRIIESEKALVVLLESMKEA